MQGEGEDMEEVMEELSPEEEGNQEESALGQQNGTDPSHAL